jgi:glycerol kinase
MSLFSLIDQSTSATKALLFDRDGVACSTASRANTSTSIRIPAGWSTTPRRSGRTRSPPLRALSGAPRPEEEGNRPELSISQSARDRCRFRTRHRTSSAARGSSGSAGGAIPSVPPTRRTGVWSRGENRAADRCLFLGLESSNGSCGTIPTSAPKLTDGSALIGTIDTYLIYRLTGGAVFATDYTNASRTLLFDIDTPRSGTIAVRALGCSPIRALPEVRESADQAGETTVAACSARPCRSVVSWATRRHRLFAQRCFFRRDRRRSRSARARRSCSISDPEGRALDHGVVTALAWVLKGRADVRLRGHHHLVGIDAHVAYATNSGCPMSPNSNDSPSALPDSGASTSCRPSIRPGPAALAPDVRAAITGLTAHSDRRHLVRAPLESIAFQVRDALDSCAGPRAFRPALHADGGPTASVSSCSSPPIWRPPNCGSRPCGIAPPGRGDCRTTRARLACSMAELARTGAC